MNTLRYFGLLLALTVYLQTLPCSAEDRPTTGRVVPRYAAFDQVVYDYMDLVGAQAATLAISNEGHLVHARGYGWSDKAKSVPTQPDNIFRMASCTKLVTAAVVKNLIRGRRLTAETPVFEYLGIPPYNGHIGDERLAHITIQHLLEHKGGWDRKQTFDPTYRLSKIKKEMGLESDINSINLIEYMLTQPLQSPPGEERLYSNFGYLVLGRVIEQATGEKYEEVVQAMICGPLGITNMRLSAENPADRDPREVYYPRESGLDMTLRDSVGGLCTSAPTMCVFLDRYWMNGELRQPRKKRSFHHSGSHPNANSCMMEQRMDGIHYVVMFNSRRNGHFGEDITAFRQAMNRTIDEIKGE